MKKEYWMAIITGLLIIGFVAIVATGVLAARQQYIQDPNPGGCGGSSYWICGNGRLDVGEECDDANDNPCDGCHECQLVAPCPPPVKVYGGVGSSSYDGVSTKRHWVPYFVYDCIETAFYETYQVGAVCEADEVRCNVKQYKDRLRLRNVCTAVWPW